MKKSFVAVALALLCFFPAAIQGGGTRSKRQGKALDRKPSGSQAQNLWQTYTENVQMQLRHHLVNASPRLWKSTELRRRQWLLPS